ncbi:MAG: ATP-dependent 6-phosphofructokinase [Polyangiaceae bacterium]|nr:ATP-dependent 6-phosphofructokinase [Polyangiaceae bacterium]
MDPKPPDLVVTTLGARVARSPLNLSTIPDDEIADFVSDDQRVLLRPELRAGDCRDASVSLEKAGPREMLHFRPEEVKAAVVTCGGLCPGLNAVIRSIVLELHHGYGVDSVLGFKFGYSGLDPATPHVPMALGLESVRSIHKTGGSLLGCARGGPKAEVMVDTLERLGINLLFTLGGDGTQKGAHAIYDEIARRGLRIGVVGVPKTIDNDVAFVDRTFGFETAVDVARVAIDGAHTEAASAPNGIGLVKLMGRDAGFVAANATLASQDVNFCLVPEVHFDLDGEYGLFAALEARLKQRGHAVVVVAEGCAKSLIQGEVERDAGGNIRYASADADIGVFLKNELVRYFKPTGLGVSLKYIDPSYMIRSGPPNAADTIFCDILGRHAVHAGMAGKTDVLIGRWYGVFTHVPLPLVTSQRKAIDPDGALWLAVSETTGQPTLSNMPVSKRAEAWHSQSHRRK